MPTARPTSSSGAFRRWPRLRPDPARRSLPGDTGPAAQPAAGLSSIGRDLLEAQKLLLAEPAAEGAAGRLESAGRVAANVLRHHGRSLDATDLEGLLQSSLLAGDAEAMSAAIDGSSRAWRSGRPSRRARSGPAAPRSRLRVDVERIDALVRLTGELLIAKNAIGHSAARAQDAAIRGRSPSR